MSEPKVPIKQYSTKSVEASILSDDKIVYTIPKRTNSHIVDLMLKIMDPDGPRPMRNMRPVQKQHNCADRFYVEHHAGYEAMCKRSRDRIQRVKTHNSAYPKMHDELNKRQSTAKPSAYTAIQNLPPTSNYDPNCRACVKLKRRAESDRKRRLASTRRTHGTRPEYRNSRDIKTKITKPKRSQRRYRTPTRLYKLDRIRMNKGCQCTVSPVQKKSVSTFNDILSVSTQDVVVAAFAGCADPYAETKRITSPTVTKPISKKASKSVIDTEAHSSVPSVSTYNSFMSMDHEPMVE